MNSIFNQILSIFAMMAYDANLTAGELKIADYAILMVDKYRESVDNLFKETAKELFLSKELFFAPFHPQPPPLPLIQRLPRKWCRTIILATMYDGCGFYDGDGYHVSQAEDDEDEEAEAEKIRHVLRQRDVK